MSIDNDVFSNCENFLQTLLERKLLRDEQYKMIKGLLENDNKTENQVLKLPTGNGKTRIFLTFYLCLRLLKKIRTLTISVPDYAIVNEIYGELKILVPNNDLIVVAPKGRNIRKSNARYIGKNFAFDLQSMKGKIIDLDFLENVYPAYDPYKLLLKISQDADIIMTHDRLIAKNNKLPTTDMLIIDDGDRSLRRDIFILRKYDLIPVAKGGMSHLQVSTDKTDLDAISDLTERETVQQYQPHMCRIVDLIGENLPDIIEIEAHSVRDKIERTKALEKGPFAHLLKERINRDIKTDIEFGLTTATSILKQANDSLNIDALAYLETYELSNDYTFKGPEQERQLIERLKEVMQYPEFIIREVVASGRTPGYVLVTARRKQPDLNEIVKTYKRCLYVSATGNSEGYPFSPGTYSMVENNHDQFGVYHGIELVNSDISKELIKRLSGTHNIFGYCRSKRAVDEAIEEYGGELLLPEQLKEAMIKIRSSKGNLYWVYAKGNLTTGVNSLADFDIFFIHSYIFKTEKEYNSEHADEVFNSLYQAVSRVLRTVNGPRNKRVITDDPVLYERFQQMDIGWNFSDLRRQDGESSEEYLDRAISEIRKDTQPLEIRKFERKKWKISRRKDGLYETVEGDPFRIPETLEGEYYDTDWSGPI